MTADPDSRLDLADAICARLCHDFSGPLGTLIGSLELMSEDADAAVDALPLASEVASALGARLRLLRAAWAGDCGPLSGTQLAGLAGGLPGRVRADLSGLQGSFASAEARVLVNLLLLGTEALPRGGVVALSGASGGDVLATVDGPGAAWPAGLAANLLAGAEPSFGDPRQVQPPLLVLLARAAGLRLSLLMPPGAAASPAPLLCSRQSRPS